MSKKAIIIGAGAAGLVCAKRLVENDFEVSIFDKSRGIGGRLASRRIENGIFNHGARHLPNFKSYKNFPEALKILYETAIKKKVLLKNGKNFTSFGSIKTFTSYLSEGLNIKKESEIVDVKREKSGIRLYLMNADKIKVEDSFLIFAIPQPQALKLLKNDFSNLYELIKPAKMAASITGLFAFETPILLNQSFIKNDYIIGFHENSRIGQNLKLDCWTIHSNKSYGKKWSHLNKYEIKSLLLHDFQKLVSINLPTPIYSNGHRWLYGHTEKSLNKNYILDQRDKIGICGDWCRGDNVLDASVSGTLLADNIISSIIE